MNLDERLQAAISAGHPEWAELPCSVKDARSNPEIDTTRTYRTFSGKPCKRGHIGPRLQPSATCLACELIRYGPTPSVALSGEQGQQMLHIYATAAACDTPRQVDHIVPLNHPDVCGLHVPLNLQLLTPADNQRKGNSFDGTMENEAWRNA